MKNVKALALLSGGLDSTLAVKLLLEQRIEVEAINFVSPFCLCKRGGCGASEVAKRFNIPLEIVTVGKDYLKVVKSPKFGYGKNMNPCIDCRIFMLKKAKKYARKTGASFIFTGEVLNERPMSQHFNAMKLIEEEAGLKGKILRPLSAKVLPMTVMEKKGLVNRVKLMGICGRSRKKQIELAKKFSIVDYPCPAGGCLLTYKEFSNKLRDLFNHRRRISLQEIALLKLGRHFRFGNDKIIVGRNEIENKTLLKMKQQSDYYFEVPDCGSPITILQGPKTRKAIQKAATLTAYYSDKKEGDILVKFGKENLHRSITVSIPNEKEVEELRII
jgi:hypothetical protein